MNESPATVVGDGLVNIVSGLGTSRDKNYQSYYQKSDSIDNWEELEAFYQENWVAQKIVSTVALDMTREWRTIKAQSLSPAQIEEFHNEEVRLGLKGKVQEAIMWARLYGGAVVIPLLKGQTQLGKQLNMNSIKKDSLTGFNVIEARSIYPSTRVVEDPFSSNYLLPEYYTAIGSNQRIHHTRLVRFIGKPYARYERIRHRYWGMSAIQAVRRTLIEAETGVAACASLLHEMNMDIISVKNLSQAMAAGQEAQIRDRMALYHSLKSIWNVVVVDSDEQVNSRQLSLSGMDRLLEQFYKIVSGACDIPYTRLMGQSAAGFNATGESDSRNYYDMLHNEQEMQLRPALTAIDEMICRSLWGKPVEDFRSEFNPLWQETAAEKAARQKVMADRDKIYLDSTVLAPSIVAKQLRQDGVYDNISDEYLEDLEEAEEESLDTLMESTNGKEAETATNSNEDKGSSSTEQAQNRKADSSVPKD